MDRMQGAGALLAERADQNAIFDRKVQALRERMLVEIGQKPESIRGGLGLAELGEVLLHGLLQLGRCDTNRSNNDNCQSSWIKMSELDQKITGRQIAAARVLIGMNQPELAKAAHISVPTLKRMEASEGHASGLLNNALAVRRALEAAGVIFVDENGQGPGVRLRKAK
jgi:hypothetical protein